MRVFGRVVGLVLATWLAIWSSSTSAMPAARLPSTTVTAIKAALSTPTEALQLLRDNDLTINSVFTGKNQTLLHLIAEMPDDNASLAALDHVIKQEGGVENINLNAADSDGLRPLHSAAKLGKERTVERLLGHNAQANIQDNDSKSPIDYANDGGHESLAALLQNYADAYADTEEDLPDTQEEDIASAVPEYLVNLNELAAAGEIDPVVGRVDEIMNVIEALSKRRKNNPLLVGAAGVGKTAIADGVLLISSCEKKSPRSFSTKPSTPSISEHSLQAQAGVVSLKKGWMSC